MATTETSFFDGKPNSLIREKSLYLLQHAHNPVHWHSWGDEAFQVALRRDVPVLVSIGYATCHWCHVMEGESFEDLETTKIMNEGFVCIKVDREERPDVDSIYMNALHLMGQQGGWPLNVFCTPEGRPFYGGTYFPPESHPSMPSFREVLLSIGRLWREDREKIIDQSKKLTDAIRRLVPPAGDTHLPSVDKANKNSLFMLQNAYDEDSGGFAFHPVNKFPPSLHLSQLLVFHYRSPSSSILEMTENTLLAMRRGGIYDQLGGGLSRYSTDRSWLVPHFEKMLYDNALYATALVETYQETGKRIYLEVAEDVLAYLCRDMRDPEGAFYSAEDADSEGVEGLFYLWDKAEVHRILPEDMRELAGLHYGISERGNFEGKNVLFTACFPEECAKRLKQPRAEIEEKLLRIREIMRREREKRIRPLRDDKIISSWNALAIIAFCKVGWASDNPKYLDIAQGAACFLLEKLMKKDHLLLRRYRDGEAKYSGYLVDYASLALAFIHLYEASFDRKWLERADGLTRSIVEYFDTGRGAYYETDRRGEKLVAETINAYDGVEPAGNSGLAHVFLRLAAYFRRPDYEERAKRLFGAFQRELETTLSSPVLLSALNHWSSGYTEVILTGDQEGMKKMLAVLRHFYLPDLLIACKGKSDLSVLPMASDQRIPKEGSLAYVCRNRTCFPPVDSPEALKSLLQKSPGRDSHV